MTSPSGKRPWLRILLALGLGLSLIWIVWSERRPEHEAWLRSEAQTRLQAWFPDTMQPKPSDVGFDRPIVPGTDQSLVILIHGLDEPGGIFDRLSAALERSGYPHTRFRYPNDQSIAQSTDLLARHWSELPQGQRVVLLGHSMGGLLIRDFVTRSRHGLGPDSADVVAALLIGTPNQGSEWARLRVWLELRDLIGSESADDFGLFAGLRDGTGAAKIDLRPGSRFLHNLNAREWPSDITLRILGGEIRLEPDQRQAGLDALEERTGDPGWSRRFGEWLNTTTSQLGDGVVSIESLPAPGAPAPDVVTASHRGLLRSGPFNNGTPPGIAWTLEQLAEISKQR